MDRRFILKGLGAGTVAVTAGPALIDARAVSAFPVGAAHAQTGTGAAEPQIIEMVLGSAEAPVTVIEYASYTCPHCARFHEEVLPVLKRDYIDPGQVRFVYREVYFDRFGLWASMIARCSGEERFFGVSDVLYASQREWVQGDPATVAENLRRIGRSVGLSEDELQTCLSDATTAQALVDWYQANMEEHPIGGTPSFVIDGELYPNIGLDRFTQILDDRLAAAE